MNVKILNFVQPASAPAKDAHNTTSSGLTACMSRAVDAPRSPPHQIHTQFAPGQDVRVRAGTFVGFEGTILKHRNDLRCVIALNLERPGVYLELDEVCLDVIR